MKDFNGKTAVVTGAASGIGQALAGRFAQEGMRVVLADVERGALEKTAAEIAASGAETLAVRTDVSKQDQVRELAERAYERFGAVHVVCNNAGVGGGAPLLQDEPLDDWQWVIGVNLWGVIHGVHAFLPRMIAGGEEGHIVNTASMAGLLAGPFMGAYNVSKFGVVALTETLFHELSMANANMRVSVLCPGFVNTNIADAARNRPGGPYPTPAEGSPEAMGRLMMRQLLSAGMDPEAVADKVFDAIRNEKFYILTHPEYAPNVRARGEAIAEGRNPTSPGFL